MKPGDRAGPRVEQASGGPDRGAASVLLLAVGLVLVMAGLGGAAIGTARVARHQAQNAADLAALAGATDAVFGESVACARAARLAAANGARLTSCTVDGLEIVVRAEVAVQPLPGVLRKAAASARAGPISAPVG
jgi:secretion/DNA translocation related TadE-like protein